MMIRCRAVRAPHDRLATDNDRDPTTAYLAPFVAITATAMLTGALSAGFDWLYPVRVITTGAVLWVFRKSYTNLRWTWSWWSLAVGFGTFVIWLAVMPSGLNDKAGWPAALVSIPWQRAGVWLLFRIAGYVVTVPLAEELAFRGFLTRFTAICGSAERLPECRSRSPCIAGGSSAMRCRPTP
jgi:membrane protease YdiL (CAAX protease family)